MPNTAGNYDPLRATIYRPVTTCDETTNNEPIQTTEIFCRRHIRFPRDITFGVERPIQHNTQAYGQTRIRMRRDQTTINIDPSMEIHHNNRVYGIIVPATIPVEQDEVEFLCQYKAKSTLVLES